MRRAVRSLSFSLLQIGIAHVLNRRAGGGVSPRAGARVLARQAGNGVVLPLRTSAGDAVRERSGKNRRTKTTRSLETFRDLKLIRKSDGTPWPSRLCRSARSISGATPKLVNTRPFTIRFAA